MKTRSTAWARLLGALLLGLLLAVGGADLGQNPAQAAEERFTADNGGATVSGLRIAPEGRTLEFSGTGWKNTAGTGGDVVGIKLDEGGVERKQDIGFPAEFTNADKKKDKSILASVKAGQDGTWTASVPFPTAENSTADPSAWKAGTSHSVRVLSGSLAAGDSGHTVKGEFTVGDSSGKTPVVDPDDEGTWTKATARAADGGSDGTISVRPYSRSENKIRIKGTGWTKKDGKSGSVVAIKLNYSNQGTAAQYTRPSSDTAIGAYLTGHGKQGDSSIWALAVPEGTKARTDQGLFTLAADGSFDITVDAPKDFTGDYLSVFAQSGRNADGDASRSVTTAAVPVDGVRGQKPAEKASTTQCVSSQKSPKVQVLTPQVSRGGRVHLKGSGYCNTTANTGAARVAVKIDEAKYSHPAGQTVNSNPTIWQIIEPNDADGTFDVWVQLPDGTEKTSTPAFADGGHSFRFLSGSLKEGDKSSTYGGKGVVDFTVGAYKPADAPDPIAVEDLNAGNRHGVVATVSGDRMTVTVPNGKKGDWVHTSAYQNGSRRTAWLGQWQQLNERKQVSYAVDHDVLRAGKYSMVVQSGNQGSFGTVLGWAPVTLSGSSGASGSSNGSAAGSGIDHGASARGTGTSTADGGSYTASRPSTAAETAGLRPGNYRTVAGSDYQPAADSGFAPATAQVEQDQTEYVVVRHGAEGQDTVVKRVVRHRKKAQPSASPQQSESAAAQQNDDDAAATRQTAEKHGHRWFSTPNLLLVAAAGLLLLLVLTGGKKKPSQTDRQS